MNSGAQNTWRVEAEDFPASGTDAAKLEFLVNYAVLAPSKCNAQPWLFEICGGSLDLICDRNWAFRELDPEGRELLLSCGAALLNLRVAARYFGYDTRVETFPWPGDKYLLARVRLEPLARRLQVAAETNREDAVGVGPLPGGGKSGTIPVDEGLFEALKQRCTSRRWFQRLSPPAGTVTALRSAVAPYNTWLHGIEDPPTRSAVGDLIAKGVREQLAKRPLRRELVRWVRRPYCSSRDGFPTSRFGLHGPLAWLSPGVSLGLRFFDLGDLVAYRDRRLAQNAPLLAVLGTAEDTHAAWLSAGQALEMLWLKATAAGLSVSLFSQPIDVRHLRTELTRIIGRTGFPQVLLRVGYGFPVPHTPRRPAKEVLI